jgi:5-methylcytosine-specific restriction protein B
MVATPVEAVWVWYYGGSNQKWTYGRYGDDNGFTKDHLQINAEASEPIRSIYGLTAEKGQERELQLIWPGGDIKGKFMFSSGRFVLRWERRQGQSFAVSPWSAPGPWRMVPSPDASSVSPLRGDGTATTDVDALAAIKTFNETGTDAYLVAVKLKGRDDELHVRTYLKNPKDDLAFASTELLPRAVRELITAIGTSPTCKSRIVGGRAVDDAVVEASAKLEENPNLLLVGPPGTGKSVLLDKLVQHVTSPDLQLTFDPDVIYDGWGEPEDEPGPGKAATVVLHPSYSYDNLVVGLLPKVNNKSVEVGVTTGPLVNLAHYAANGRRALLVLDEFNRGNAAAVLGDTLALLDKDKRDVAHVDLPAYDLPIEVPSEFAADGNTLVDPRLSLPSSLWIVAAMNSSDRSVAPLDAALRRRFSIVEIGPDYDLLARRLNAADAADLASPWDEWTPATVARLAVVLLEGINARIDASLGRDFRLGHSNFWHLSGSSAEEVLRSLASAWDLRVVQTLRLALQDDDDTLAFILKAGKPSDAVKTSLQAVWWQKADPRHEQFSRPRLSFNTLADMTTSTLHSELIRLAGA